MDRGFSDPASLRVGHHPHRDSSTGWERGGGGHGSGEDKARTLPFPDLTETDSPGGAAPVVIGGHLGEAGGGVEPAGRAVVPLDLEVEARGTAVRGPGGQRAEHGGGGTG